MPLDEDKIWPQGWKDHCVEWKMKNRFESPALKLTKPCTVVEKYWVCTVHKKNPFLYPPSTSDQYGEHLSRAPDRTVFQHMMEGCGLDSRGVDIGLLGVDGRSRILRAPGCPENKIPPTILRILASISQMRSHGLAPEA